MTRKQWRCFFCDKIFKRRQDAAEHFGCDDACEADVPACRIAAHEGHLVHYIRKLENELRRYVTEDSDVMRSIMTLEAEHRQALIRAEEEGYGRGVRDAREGDGWQPIGTLQKALAESLSLQAHYATLLNDYDGGSRIVFKNVDNWIARLYKTGRLAAPPTAAPAAMEKTT